MPRPRKPTKLHELSGAFAKNPKRRNSRSREPFDEATLGARPTHLPIEVARAWDEIVAMAVPGVMRRADRLVLEGAARLTVRCRSLEATAADFTQWRAYLQQLGMTPAARSLVTTPEPEKHNDFAAA